MYRKTAVHAVRDVEDSGLRSSKGEVFVRRFKKDSSGSRSKAQKQLEMVSRKLTRNISLDELAKPARKEIVRVAGGMNVRGRVMLNRHEHILLTKDELYSVK